NKSVIVVEHDLLILDYLADLVHILFGKAAVYGVVSHPKSAKAGINTYLSGYLKDENIRFRDHAIKFEIAPPKKAKGDLFMNWPKLTKKLSSFNLEVESSEIYKKEIVGIVGANAIGKTTFAQILAGELKPDSGEIKHKVKISYKPQYIEPTKTKVLATLMKINKETLSQENKISIINPLQIEHLLNKNLDELSGGELQRIAIAACLLREADLYLLDEPSTYLDVEQRLAASKTIQKVIKSREAAALVIDHDLLFISYLSDRLLAFSGEPGKTGQANKIISVKKGMNDFLKELGITCRKEPETGRPRVNKPDSVKDREQKEKGEYYL
ncbi:ribosome biogenesis/translation initiation ATPase RLI, partial [Candidatus Woesearchaeota archaeon]|nr:ribosome biogenesis/translation initiation ATPase RLI [Candidatus Woesearchaeota archaeon]